MAKFLALIICFTFAISSNLAFAETDSASNEIVNNTTDLTNNSNNSLIAKDYLSGEFAAKTSDYATATKRFESALAEHPEEPLLLQNAFKFSLMAGDYDKAAEYAPRYLQYDKKAPAALLFMAIRAASAGEYTKALEILEEKKPKKKKSASEKIVITGVEQLIIPFIRIWALAGGNDFDKALSALASSTLPKIVSSGFVNLQKALLYSIQQQNDLALAYFSEITKDSSLLSYNVARPAASFYQTIGRNDLRDALYQNYRNVHPSLGHFENVSVQNDTGLYVKTAKDGMAEIMKEAARLLLSNQIYEDGLVYLRLALLLKPGDDEATMLLASFFEQNNNLETAINLYKNISEKSDFFYISQINKADDLYKIGKKEEAKDLFIEMGNKMTRKYIPLVTYADLLRRDSKYKEAIEVYSKILLNIDPKHKASWAIFFARGICYERMGNWQRAEQDLLFALDLNPESPELVNYLAYSWVDHNKNMERARDMLLKAAAKRPSDPQILDSAGWALYKLKDYKNAVLFIEKAAELLPTDAVINDHLGDVYWKVGRHYEARYQWQRSIKYGPAESSTKEQLENKISKGLP